MVFPKIYLDVNLAAAKGKDSLYRLLLVVQFQNTLRQVVEDRDIMSYVLDG